ncbi:MAG TPA: M50 family metallopeptidase [Streptosporangiaceae bacterium]
MTVTQVPLSGAAATLIGLGALGVTMIGPFWRILKHGTVMAHEGAHAAGFALIFHKVGGIGFNADATGVTAPAGDVGCLAFVFVAILGYLGPSLFGLAAAKMIETGHIVEMLWVTLFLLTLLLLAVTTKFGVFTVIVAGGIVFLVLRYTPLDIEVIAAYAIAWLLLLTGVRRVLEVGIGSGDGANLARQTFIPRFIWFLFWLAGTLAAVAIGAKWLIFRT